MLVNNYPVLFVPKARESVNPVHTFSARYYHEIFNLRCGPDLIRTGLYKSAKEWTESAAVFNAAERYLPWDMDKELILISYGDGCQPRTAALFAFRTKWQCYSVDPDLRDEDWSSINRLSLFKGKGENFELDCQGKVVVALFVHAHVPIVKAVKPLMKTASAISAIAMPCCMILDNGLPPPNFSYYDSGVESDKRQVKIWSNILDGYWSDT